MEKIQMCYKLKDQFRYKEVNGKIIRIQTNQSYFVGTIGRIFREFFSGIGAEQIKYGVFESTDPKSANNFKELASTMKGTLETILWDRERLAKKRKDADKLSKIERKQKYLAENYDKKIKPTIRVVKIIE